LLVNGAAAVRPVCVPPKYLSLQIKYPSCLSGQANKTQPTLQVFRVDNLPNVSVCNVVNSAASTVTNGTGPISPPDASSLCTNVNTLMPNVTYKVALGPNNSAVATYQSVSCYDMSNPASPVNITNADGSFTTKNPPVDITW
jgi:hypothetical protein